jgi:hypothetical protein
MNRRPIVAHQRNAGHRLFPEDPEPYHAAVHRLLDTIGGLWELLRLALRTRFRFSGPYWRWRIETAFGSDRRRWPPLRERIMAALEYGRWVHRMRRERV